MKANYLIVSAFSAMLAACQPHPPPPLNAPRTPSPILANNAPKTFDSNGEVSTNANSIAVKNTNQTVKPAPTVAPILKPTISTNDNSAAIVKPKLKNYTARGIVKQIDFESGSIIIDHEDIGDYMVAMEMPFPVVNRNILKKLKIGDQVEFVLETGVGVERIVGIRKK